VLVKIEKEKVDYPCKPLHNGDYVLFAFGLFIGLYTLAFFGRRRMNKRTKLPA